MKTLLISEIFPPKTGGSGRWFWEIYRRLPNEAFAIAAGENPKQAEFDRTHNLRLRRVPLNFASWGIGSIAGFRGYWNAWGTIRRIVRTDRPDMIHCGKCLPEGLIARVLKAWYGIPFICYVHGEEVSFSTTSRELTWLTHLVLNAAEFVIVNSRNTGRLLEQEWRLPSKKIRLLHPGCDTEKFVPAARDMSVRARLGWHRRPVILTVGRLQKRKGQDNMILALNSIRKAMPDVLYAIVGDGEEREALENLVAREGLFGHVQFLGEMNDDELTCCYQQCDLFVLANRKVGKDIEGFGMVLVEAQACGRPVVAGASGGTGETMQVPVTGRIVNCDGPDMLAELVIELLDDPEQLDRMGAAGREWAVEHFDWTALTRKAARIFGCQIAATLEILEPINA